MRVLHVHTDLVGGGIEQMMATLAIHTCADEVGICWCPANHPEPPQETVQQFPDRGVRLHRIPPPFLSPLYPVRLARVIRRVRPDILHLHGASIGVIGAVVGRMQQVPAIVYTEHVEHTRIVPWLRRLREMAARLPHGTVFPSHATRSAAVNDGAFKRIESRCSIIHNGADLSVYRGLSDDASRPLFRDELGIAADQILVGCVGLLRQIKGQEYLIRALRQLRDKRCPIIALLVGSGGDERRLRACAAEESVADRVQFLGWRGDVPRILKALDLYVQPSISETFGLTVVEAAAAGLPIVASEVGGIPEIITHGHDGLLVAPGNPNALAAALQALLDDPERARRLGENARKIAFERFSAEAMAAKYMELYNRLLAARS